MNEIKGHIYKILWNTLLKNNEEKYSVGMTIIDENNQQIKIKGFMKIEPFPSINDYIIATKNNLKDDSDMIDCKSINIQLPIKKEYILNLIKNIIKDNKLKPTIKEINFIIDNNKDIWDSMINKNLIIGEIKLDKISLLYDSFLKKCTEYGGYKDEEGKLKEYLHNNNISLKKNQIDKLLKVYGESNIIIYTINKNLIELLGIEGINIKTLINIANSLNFSIQDKINLIILNILINSPNGDTCILYNNLIKLLLKDNYLQNDIDLSINYLKSEKKIIHYNNYLYESNIFEYEKNIGSFLSNNKDPFLSDFLEDAIYFLDNYDDYKLNTEQYNSLLNIFKFNVNITVGPAGSGKSEILIRLAKFVDQYSDISILFLAPTGKACDRLTKGFKSNDLDHRAFTIHKFNYSEFNKECNSNIEEFNNIIQNCYKIFVIDEMSMICLQIFNTFINKINNLNNCILFILGDTNQLPSISYGDILNNLVISNVFSVVKLQHIYRTNSLNLLKAQENVLLYKKLCDNFIESDNTFSWIKKYPLNNDFFINFLSTEFKDKMPFIITSTNKIIDMYQDKIKDIYNPNYLELESVIVNNIYFHINDIIMIKKNNYELELMNGMIGRIISIVKPIVNDKIKYNSKKYRTLTMVTILFEGENESRTLSLDDLDDISMAYLITIHKSQGSEYDNVVILLDNAPMNTINLLYTAITRTKKRCFLIADEYTINYIIQNKRFTKRLSCLQDFCK